MKYILSVQFVGQVNTELSTHDNGDILPIAILSYGQGRLRYFIFFNFAF
jgi:hypothetical protein